MRNEFQLPAENALGQKASLSLCSKRKSLVKREKTYDRCMVQDPDRRLALVLEQTVGGGEEILTREEESVRSGVGNVPLRLRQKRMRKKTRQRQAPSDIADKGLET